MIFGALPEFSQAMHLAAYLTFPIVFWAALCLGPQSTTFDGK
jgi:hypothetical protein